MADIVWMKCEGCGATLEFPDESSVGKCNYCGGQFLIVDPTEIHYHEEVNLHEHYGTEGKSFAQLKYLKKMLEEDLAGINIDCTDKEITTNNLCMEWLKAINFRKELGINFMLSSIFFFIFHNWHFTFIPMGILMIVMGTSIYFSNPQDEHDRYTVAQSEFDELVSEIHNSFNEKQAKLEHIKNAMLELV